MRGLRAGLCAGWTGLALAVAIGCGSDARPVVPEIRAFEDQPAASDAAVVPDASVGADAGVPPVSDGAILTDAGWPSDAADADVPASPAELVAPEVRSPSYLGILVGPGTREPHADLRLYGADLGISFEHAGELQMLFGDSWVDAEQVCRDAPLNDDTLAVLPKTFTGAVPPVRFATDAAAPRDALAMQVLRGDESLSMGFGQVPMAAFSDGPHAFAFFARLAPTECGASADQSQCPLDEGMTCSDRIGECEPAYTTMTLSCDLETGLGCLPGQECVEGPPVCIDPNSAQYDSSIFGETSAVAQRVELALQGERSHEFRSVVSWPTSKFATLNARTVTRLSGKTDGNDFTPGHGELLVWGRPGFVGEHGREAQLYLMRHSLPLELTDEGGVKFEPRYFGGLDPDTREPVWTTAQGEAQALALDGVTGGSPHEELQFTGQLAVSWLGAPIDKWVMLYGGDLTDFLMVDAASARSARAPGAIMIRFADQPWGPWSPPTPQLAPGTPDRAGSLYAPGGLLYHPDCVDTPEADCSVSDAWRPPDSATACLVSTQTLDPGRLYGVNIIDNYTQPNDEGGLDFVWNVSTWNPYAVALMKTRVVPPAAATNADELADAKGLERMSDLGSLAVLEPGRRYRQQTSRDRGTDDASFPLSGFGNRDFNNFVCKSADAQLAPDQFAPFYFDEPQCEEPYVKGVVLGRFEGPGRMVRMWIGMASLLLGPADEELLRIYVDDEPTPRVEVKLADALDGSAGEIFAPPFGVGSPRRMAWYYPVAFEHKLIVALDKLGDFDEYYYHCDVVHDAPSSSRFELASRNDRQRALTQLSATYHPEGEQQVLAARETLELAAGHARELVLEGPATIHELELRVMEEDLASLAQVRVRVRWDDAGQDAIDVPLLALFASARTPPEGSTPALTSFEENGERALVLKLPMPFTTRARWTFDNQSSAQVSFELVMRGASAVPAEPFGKLHVLLSAIEAPTTQVDHESVELAGRGRLVGVCAYLEGRPDPDGGIQYDGLNLLEGDVRIWTDGELALDGTGTEEYADDVFYFTDAPHATPFVQAWGLVNDPVQSALGEVSMCRWHVLGTEVDFERELDVRFELGGAGNPEIVAQHRTVAYVYLE